MPVDWTPHRFSGGLLALDLANTVVHRGDPQRRFDRFAEPDEITRFATAAGLFRRAELGGRVLLVADPKMIHLRVVELREATDALFRGAALSGDLHSPKLERLLRASADALAGHDERFGEADRPEHGRPIAFEAFAAGSALALLAPQSWGRVRICPACGWLFADGSRNGSRRWCDMAVCGNRRKAQLHHARTRKGGDDAHA